MPLSHARQNPAASGAPRPYGELDAFESVEALDLPEPSQKDHDRARDLIEHFRHTLSEKESQGDFGGMAACYLHLGDAYLAKGEAEKAEAMYRKSLALSRLVRAQAAWTLKRQ